jgi:hypothetical protein
MGVPMGLFCDLYIHYSKFSFVPVDTYVGLIPSYVRFTIARVSLLIEFSFEEFNTLLY